MLISDFFPEISISSESQCSSSRASPIDSISSNEESLDWECVNCFKKEKFNYNLHKRVKRWVDQDPTEPISQNIMLDYRHCPQGRLLNQLACHGFTTDVDHYIQSGLQTHFHSNQRLNFSYILPAVVKNILSNSEKKGLFIYTIDSKVNSCYHRYFHVVSKTQTIESHLMLRGVSKKELNRLKQVLDKPNIPSGSVVIYDIKHAQNITLLKF